MYCLLFTLLVKLGVGGNALNGLFFYPKPVRERAFALGLTEPEAVARRRGPDRADFLTVFMPI